jgi:hypothetical protein
VAQRGWAGVDFADSVDEVRAGLNLEWVEVDGHRFEDVVSAELKAEEGFTTLHVEFIGTVEVVYLGRDGQELGSQTALERFRSFFGSLVGRQR